MTCPECKTAALAIRRSDPLGFDDGMRIIPALLLCCLAAAPAWSASPLEGSWTNPKGSVTVRIAPCGELLCGRVISATAKARDDAAAGGTAQLVGAELMSDLEQVGEDQWRGSIFVPDANRRADAQLRLVGPRTLEVQGCALGGLLCRSQEWTRVAAGRKSSARKRR